MGIEDVYADLLRWREGGSEAGVATLVEVRRSAPRLPGARFAASAAGDVAGSVSSGCVEGDLFEHIQAVLREGEPRRVHYGISDEMAAGVGLSCGGEIDVLVAPFEDAGPWERLRERIRAEEATLLVTGVSEGLAGRQMLLLPGGERHGSLGGPALDRAVEEAAARRLDIGGAELLQLEAPEATVFVEAYLPPPRLAIVGAGPVAEELCRLGDRIGLSVSVVDPRETFASPERFPAARRVLHRWPEEGFEELGLDRYWSVVVLAHDAKLDVPALAAALRAGCLYVGQIGGRRTQSERRQALAERGLGEEALGRIHGPVGLDIGAESPAEIAVSIAAELLAVRRGIRK